MLQVNNCISKVAEGETAGKREELINIL